MDFVLPLQEKKVKTHQITALHLIAGFVFIGMSAFLLALYFTMRIMPFSWDQVQGPTSTLTVWPEMAILALGVFIIIVGLFHNRWLLRPAINKAFRITELIVAFSIAVYALYNGAAVPAASFGLLGAALLLSIFWEKDTQATLKIKVDEQGVALPIIAKRRHIDWPEISQIMIKYGTLTINCCDNRMYQWVLGRYEVDEEAFDQFCTEQIKAGEKDRKNYDW